MDQPRDDLAELRVGVSYLRSELGDIRTDVRRLDDRLVQLMLLQVGTLATALASLVAALVS